ncbi:MAG: FimV/HubP family polar landmark protein, partial [Pseudohongiella sp.]
MVKRLMPIFSALLLFAAAQIHALSLGDITLESATGEPLQASIELMDSEGLSAADISVMVASAADFQRFDAERIAALDSLRIDVEFADGVPVLRISSPVSIDEPFLNLILDTRWPAGRVLTEYTLRLESPAFSAQSTQQVSAAPVQSVFEPVAEPETDSVADDTSAPPASAQLAAATGADVATADAGPGTTTSTAPAAAGQNEPAQIAPAAAPDDLANASTLTVNAGDTLWELALRARPDDSVSVQQTMLALQRLNPDAFQGNNINRVKRGEVLRVPELNEIRRLAAAEAIAAVTRQNREFAQPGTVGREPVTAGPDAASGGAAQGELRVVTADDDTDDSADASASAANTQSAEQDIARNDEQLDALEDSLALREEELDRLDLENSELNTRLAMLQQQIASAQEIIRLRDLELAQLQQQLAETEPAETETDGTTRDEQTTTITMAPDAGPVERFFNLLISNTWALLGAAAVLILLLVLVLMRRNRATTTGEQRAQRENDDMPLGEESDDELLFSGVAAAAAAAEEADNEDAPADDERLDESVDGREDESLDEGLDEGLVESPDENPDPANPSAQWTEDTVFNDEFALDDTLEMDPEADTTTDADTDADEGPDWGDTEDMDLDDETDDDDAVADNAGA